MKKRFWIILLTLILALGALCVGASAENETFAASVTSDGVTRHYATVREAFDAAKDGDTVGILNFDTTETKDLTVAKNLTVELLGSVTNPYSLRFRVSGSVTFISAGLNGSPATFAPIVVVENGGTLTVPEYYDSEKTAANAISFANVLVESGSSAVLGGGTYSILAADGGTVTLSGSSVQVGLTLAVRNGGTLIAENVKLSCSFGVYSGTAMLTNCTVESDGIIASGSTVNGGSLTVNGSNSIVKNLTVKDGSVTVTGGMLTGTLTVDGGTVNVTNTVVKGAEINAGSFTLGEKAVFDEHELHICGGEAIIDAGDDDGIKDNSSCKVIVEGGKLTLRSGEIGCLTEIRTGAQAELNGGNFGIVWVNGTLTVNGAAQKEYKTYSYIEISKGGVAELLSGSCDSVQVYDSSAKLTVSGGSCSTLDVAAYCWDNVTLSGGSFGEIWVRAYEELEDRTVKKLDDIGYAQYAAMLAAGKGYQKSGGTFAGTADVTEDVYAHPDYPYKMLQNVTVADAPFKGLHITGGSSVTYGGSVTLTAKMDAEPADVTYRWYRNDTAISGETGASYTTDAALDAGDYTYTVEAASNGYVTGASYTVTVEPRVIYPILDRSKLSKEYDGTADATVVITGFSFTSGGETPDPSISAIKYAITEPHYEDFYGKITANVADAKMVVYTLTLNETNYTLKKDNDGKFYPTLTIHVEVSGTAITPASIGSYAIPTKTITILNRHQKTYEIDLREYLPALESPRDFGDVTFTIEQGAVDGKYYSPIYNPATVGGNTLTLPIMYADSDTEGSAGEIQLTVHSANYKDFILKINVDAKNKLLPAGTATPDRTALIYGEKLSDITLSGEMSCNGVPVDGSFAWTNPDMVPEIGEYDADWVFEPAEDEKYLPVRGTVRITVSPATYSVTVAEAERGSVSSNRRYASYGQTVTLTVAPENGYVLETLTVTTRSGREIALTDLGGGKYSFRMPGSRVTVAASFAEDNSVLNFFVDVPNDTFYFDAVRWAAENGITAGADALHFAPDRPCTRAEIAAFLWRAAGSPEPERAADFADVDPDAYYAKAVAWAAENGVVLGTGKGFEPDRVCTRAEAVAMIYREIQRRGGGFTGAWMFRLPFTDTIDWAYEPTAWCYMHGITEGVSETEFGSNEPCTRAHIVTFLWRAFGE